MDLSGINAAAMPGAGLLPLLKLQNLKPDIFYQITNIYKAKTKFGEAVMVNLEGTHAGFLPRRMVKFLEANPKDLEAMQIAARSNKLLMISVGSGKDWHVQFVVSEDSVPVGMTINVETGAPISV